MSIFDRFTAKTTNEQEKKSFSPAPHKKQIPGLETVKAECPDDSKAADEFVKALKEANKFRAKRPPDGNPQPVNAEARFFLSRDRMHAYACLLPPENNGAGLTMDKFLEDMHYEGINHGILRDEIQKEFELGYLRIFPVARGILPQPGEDGKVTELFRRQESICLEAQNEGRVDFSQEIQLQPVRKGAVICLIRPPKAGTDGMDVTGQKLPSPEPANPNIPQGKNTSIGRGGQALTADVDGILYIENDLFCIHEQKIIDTDVDQFQGTLKVAGNLYIEGNVDGGVDIEASGDVVVNGKIGQAKVTSMRGTIRVQQGIYGTEGKTHLSAARQVQSPVIEWAEIGAGDSVTAEMISNSTIRCEGTVYAITGRGMITGSLIRAGDSILCLRIGNLAGDRSRFSVGYPPHTPETWSRLKGELEEAQAIIEKLWTPITTLKRKGSRITDGEKAVLAQLVEQRNLYIEKRNALTAEMDAINKVLGKKTRGRIQCEKLQPVLEVQIGKLTEEITAAMENCSIHADDNKIYTR